MALDLPNRSANPEQPNSSIRTGQQASRLLSGKFSSSAGAVDVFHVVKFEHGTPKEKSNNQRHVGTGLDLENRGKHAPRILQT